MQEKRSKHIDIWYYYVRDAIEDDKIKPYHIDGARNPADILTKNLGQILFYQFHPLLGLEVLWTLLLIYIVTQWPLLWVRGSVKLIIVICITVHKQARFFISTATSRNCSASLKISLPYQAVYQYLLDNLVSGPWFVPTIIAAFHPSNKIVICPFLRTKNSLHKVRLSLFTVQRHYHM